MMPFFIALLFWIAIGEDDYAEWLLLPLSKRLSDCPRMLGEYDHEISHDTPFESFVPSPEEALAGDTDVLPSMTTKAFMDTGI